MTATWPRTRPTTAAEHDPGWRRRAACTEADPAVFFPDDIVRRPGTLGRATDAAHRWCAGCPVRAACGDDATRDPRFSLGVRAGVWRRDGHPDINLLPDQPAGWAS